METLIQDSYGKISKDKHTNCKESLGNDCFKCFSQMYYDDNEIDYTCENKRLIYIIRYLPVHSSEIYFALDRLFNKYSAVLRSKKLIVFTSWGAGPGIDTYAFHKYLEDYSEIIRCNYIINYRLESCTEWTDLAKKVMFSNSPKKLTREYWRKIKSITNPIKISESFDIATLSYIISELDDEDINELIKNIKKNKSEDSYIIINDRPQSKVEDKIKKIMSELTEDSISFHNSGHCGFDFPQDIWGDYCPKAFLNSVFFIGKLK